MGDGQRTRRTLAADRILTDKGAAAGAVRQCRSEPDREPRSARGAGARGMRPPPRARTDGDAESNRWDGTSLF